RPRQAAAARVSLHPACRPATRQRRVLAGAVEVGRLRCARPGDGADVDAPRRRSRRNRLDRRLDCRQPRTNGLNVDALRASVLPRLIAFRRPHISMRRRMNVEADMTKIWVIVADSWRARLFRVESPVGKMKEVRTL